MDYLMGIDLGSTSLKAVVYDLEGNVVSKASRATELAHPEPDTHPEWAVWLPEQIWSGTAEAAREAISALESPNDIKGVAVTGMGMDGVPVDARGKALYPFISWHDTRTMPQSAGQGKPRRARSAPALGARFPRRNRVRAA